MRVFMRVSPAELAPRVPLLFGLPPWRTLVTLDIGIEAALPQNGPTVQ